MTATSANIDWCIKQQLVLHDICAPDLEQNVGRVLHRFNYVWLDVSVRMKWHKYNRRHNPGL